MLQRLCKEQSVGSNDSLLVIEESESTTATSSVVLLFDAFLCARRETTHTSTQNRADSAGENSAAKEVQVAA